jgi:branched-chain amino acid transport system substrate-binding protein
MRSTSLHAALRGAVVLAATLLAAGAATAADKSYGPGVTDREIKLGQTIPYSGPTSAWSVVGMTHMAYIKMINDQGGINGRRINLISLDDGYSPPKTVELTRRLVEEEQVLLLYGSLGTAPQSAVFKYMNTKQVPQLFILTGAAKFGDPQHYPWTMGFQPPYLLEAEIYAKHTLATVGEPKIAILYQNDDFGKEYVEGFKRGLGAAAAGLIVKEISYEVTDPTVDSQIVTLQGSGANVLLNAGGPKQTAQAIRKVHDLGWTPLQFISVNSASVDGVIKPAGLENATGIITAAWAKDPSSKRFQQDADYQEFLGFMQRYYPSGDITNKTVISAYLISAALVQVLKQCGDELTRENVMKQAANLHGMALPMLLPGSTVDTSPTSYFPVHKMELQRFDGAEWIGFGTAIGN